MTLTQKLFTRLLPKAWQESIRAESERWQLRCTHCGHTRSVWEAGGIRWGAASKGKITFVYCLNCNGLRAHALEPRPEP